MRFDPTIDTKREAVADLARSGRWVSILIFGARLGWGRSKALAVLRALIADGIVEMQEVPSRFSDVGAERQYRVKPGADIESVTGPAKRSQRRRGERTEELVHAMVTRHGTMTANEVAEGAKLTQPTARGVLARLEAAGRLSRLLGPPPATGSQRPWVYEAKR